MSNRIGPKMAMAARYVAINPGCSKYEVARYVGPHGSNRFGDAIVLRAIAAGLIEDRSVTGEYRYRLYAV